VTKEALAALRQAARIAAAARTFGAARIVPGARLLDVCESVEHYIKEKGGQPAFPAQSSRNEIAAHYCPAPGEQTTYAKGDLAKLDIGVHVDGWVVDTATTVAVGGHAAGQRLIDAAFAALQAAIAVAGPGVPVRTLSQTIEAALRARGLNPMRNLCGHGVARWTVHCPPPIPNSPDGTAGRLEAGSVVAIEPFATEGKGEVSEAGAAEVFRVPPERSDGAGLDHEVFEAIRAFRGLPFSRRQLAHVPQARVESTLRALWERNWMAAYPPLKEASGRVVAQAEHSLYVSEQGVEVLTG
jgi:methionyl aminopeptidase